MNLIDRIKSEAREFSAESEKHLEEKITQLSKDGMSFLGCTAFIQENKNISLAEAHDIALAMSVFKDDGNLNEFLGYIKAEYQDID